MRKESFENLCVISKPIQYVNILNVPNINKSNSKLIIIQSFLDSDKLRDFVAKKGQWLSIELVESENKALKYSFKHRREYKNLYINYDNGPFTTIIFHLLWRKNIYLFDEGWGSYNNNLRKRFNPSRLVFSLLHWDWDSEMYLGSHPRVKGKYLYYPDMHKKIIPNFKKELKLKYSFVEHISKEDFSIFNYEFSDEVIGKDIILFLTGWEIDEEIYPLIENDKRYKICKPHPHRKDNSELKEKFDFVIEGYMAEFVILDLIQKANSILIYHHNSTSVIYFQNHPKINLVNMKESQEFTRIADMIKQDQSL